MLDFKSEAGAREEQRNEVRGDIQRDTGRAPYERTALPPENLGYLPSSCFLSDFVRVTSISSHCRVSRHYLAPLPAVGPSSTIWPFLAFLAFTSFFLVVWLEGTGVVIVALIAVESYGRKG